MPTRIPVPRPTIAGSTLLLLLSLSGSQSLHAAMREDEYVARVVDAGLDSRVLQAQAELSRAESVGVALWPNPSIEWERQPNPTDDRVVGGQHAIDRKSVV